MTTRGFGNTQDVRTCFSITDLHDKVTEDLHGGKMLGPAGTTACRGAPSSSCRKQCGTANKLWFYVLIPRSTLNDFSRSGRQAEPLYNKLAGLVEYDCIGGEFFKIVQSYQLWKRGKSTEM